MNAVIFDMDGLMFDTERLARDAWKRAMAEHGYALDDEVYLTAIGRTVAGACGVFVDAFGPDLPIADIEAAEARYLRDMLKPGPPLKPGLLTLLDGLEAFASTAGGGERHRSVRGRAPAGRRRSAPAVRRRRRRR